MHTVVCMNMLCNKIVADPVPVYRIFLDNQLVAERRFWPETPDYFIQEQLTLINDGSAHNVKVKNVFPDRGEIFMHDLNFFDGENRQPTTVEHSFDSEFQFTFVLPKR